MRYLFPTGKGYQRKWLGQDVLSGVVIAAVSIPISMGYAQIAGLPAVYGLYGSLLPVILFALLSTSPQFIFGVDAAPAAMIGGVLGGMGIAMGSAEAERVVPVLTFYVGIWLLLFALLRAGRVLRFVSTSVMGGFISGICCTIILMQLPKLMGGTAGTGELPELVRHLAGVQVHPLSLGLGAAALVILLAAKRLRPKFPMAIVVMGLGALATVLFDLPGRGVACLGAVEPGLPALHLPDWSAVSLTEGLGSSLPVAVVIMAETLLAESSFAMRDGYEIRDSQELLAFAAANLGAGMVGCCPVNGSVSRSSMNVQYRGKTQAVSLVAAAGMAAVLLWGSGLIRLLPVPVLTAIVISALLGAVEFDMAHRLLRADRKELAIFLAAFLGVLVLGTIYGVVIGRFQGRAPVTLPPFRLGRFPVDNSSTLAIYSDSTSVNTRCISLPFIINLHIEGVEFTQQIFVYGHRPCSVFSRFHFLRFVSMTTFPCIIKHQPYLISRRRPKRKPGSPRSILHFDKIPRTNGIEFIRSVFLFCRRTTHHCCHRSYSQYC